MSPASDAGKNRRARAIVSGFVLVVAVVFIGSSVWQIASAVFEARPTSARAATPEELTCAARLQILEAALDRGARAAAAESKDEARAREAFDAALAPEWNDRAAAEQLCSSSPRSREAWAALLRLRRGFEGSARKEAHEIGPLRRDFETRLP